MSFQPSLEFSLRAQRNHSPARFIWFSLVQVVAQGGSDPGTDAAFEPAGRRFYAQLVVRLLEVGE